MIKDKVLIRNIPAGDKIPSPPSEILVRLSKKKGDVAFVHNGSEMRFIAVLEFKAGTERGNHHHNTKEEWMYLVKGKLRAAYSNPTDRNDTFSTELKNGDLVRIHPGCIHTYVALEDSLAVEFSPQQYDSTDEFDAI